MINLMNFNLSSKKSKNLMGYFCQKYVAFDLNNIDELCGEK